MVGLFLQVFWDPFQHATPILFYSPCVMMYLVRIVTIHGQNTQAFPSPACKGTVGHYTVWWPAGVGGGGSLNGPQACVLSLGSMPTFSKRHCPKMDHRWEYGGKEAMGPWVSGSNQGQGQGQEQHA